MESSVEWQGATGGKKDILHIVQYEMLGWYIREEWMGHKWKIKEKMKSGSL
jgi:hypothetical protein